MQSKNLFVSDLQQGSAIEDLFLIAEARSAETRNGQPYWDLILQDATGKVSAKIWAPLSQQANGLAPGHFLHVQAKVELFREKFQLNITRFEEIDPEGETLDWSAFVPRTAEAPEAILEDLEQLCRNELQHKPWRALCRSVLRDPEIRQRLLQAPAAKSVHHAYRGGLLEHTRQVCRVCLQFAALYPDLDKELLFVAALFHDFGKAWELEGLATWDYSDAGQLLGHIHLGLERLEPFLRRQKGLDPELALHLKHAILSHHGELEFGSPKRPKTPEAFALHFADNLDSKLTTASAALNDLGEHDGGWTPKVWALQRQLFKRTPTPAPMATQHRPREDQCSLPLKE